MRLSILAFASLAAFGLAGAAFAEGPDPAPGVETQAAPISWTGSGLLSAAAATSGKLPFETIGPPAVPGNPAHPIVPGNPIKVLVNPGFGTLTVGD